MNSVNLPDPEHHFNTEQEAKTSRFVDTYQQDVVNEIALKQALSVAVK